MEEVEQVWEHQNHQLEMEMRLTDSHAATQQTEGWPEAKLQAMKEATDQDRRGLAVTRWPVVALGAAISAAKFKNMEEVEQVWEHQNHQLEMEMRLTDSHAATQQAEGWPEAKLQAMKEATDQER
ncbi:hypothetical protein COO60DRAFT_1460851 [Scenedesmus sp. NREL 46B-D3]|nr:hypothetical protein COO60DRAFT_1460851 [Scenedesmus sp. NREL 46B-D3]